MSFPRTFLVLLLVLGGIKAPTITSPPQDAIILFGDTAVFNCTGEGDLLSWTTTVDGQRRQIHVSIADHSVPDDMVSSSLHINATIDVVISCRIITYSPFGIVSAGAVLTVRLISPVENLSLSIDDVPYVTWTIPSVIAPDISVSDIRYTVTLEGGNITSPVDDIDDTYYQFTNITVLNCTVYTATVTAYVKNRDMHRSGAAKADDSDIS